MWDWHWWWCFLPTTLQKQHHHHHHHPQNQSLLLTADPQNDAVCSNCISFSAVARMLTSWLNRRRRRYLLLILCSPFLLPLLCATCPLICAVEICFFMCRRRRKTAAGGGDGQRRSEEGGDEVGLLQRYLEDQLMLVFGSVYECGDDHENVEEEGGVNVGYFDSTMPLLQ